MKAFWTRNFVPILFAVGGLGWLIKPLKQLIRGEPLDGAPIAIGCMFFVVAAVIRARRVVAARKAENASGTPSA